MNKLPIYLLVILFCFSCDEQPVDIPIFEPPTTDKVVLLEDLTGVKCPNCPSATAKAEVLRELYDHKVIVVGVHGPSLSSPLSESQYDFRNEFANSIEDMLKPFLGKPAGGINRVRFDNVPENEYAISDSDIWGTYIEQEFQKPHQVELVLNSEFNADTRELSVSTRAIPLEDLSGEFYIGVMLLESGIVDPQKFPTETQLDYVHNHVMRTMLTAHIGDPLATSMTRAEPIDKTFTTTLPAEDGTWIAENMDIVAFIAKKDGPYFPIMQAAEKHLVD